MTRHIRRTDDDEVSGLANDQGDVFDAHFGSVGVRLSPAGSGTGKTTTAIEILAEAVYRELDSQSEPSNPFPRFLVTTFTKDAARQLKVALKDRLREHKQAVEAAGDAAGDPIAANWERITRWIETDSHVQTLDSFAQEQLREVADDLGITPSFTVADGSEYVDLVDGIVTHLRSEMPEATAVLSDAYPGEQEYDDSWWEMIATVHRKCREFDTPVADAAAQIVDRMDALFEHGRISSAADVADIIDEYTDDGMGREHIDDAVGRAGEEWVAYARSTYERSNEVAEAFAEVLVRYDELYTRRSERRGTFTHTDVLHYVREYLEVDEYESERRAAFRESLRHRFRHVIVDEAQDTNASQLSLLSHLVPSDCRDTRMLLIGDLKQSIYAWRSADPELFAGLLADARNGRPNDLGVDPTLTSVIPLQENFRSNPHLVDAANHLFTNLFHDEATARGRIGTFDIDYRTLTPRRQATPDDDPHLHTYDLTDLDRDGKRDGESWRDYRARIESERIASRLATVFDRDPLYVDEDRHTTLDADDPLTDVSDLREAEPGDVALLFRSRTHMDTYASALDAHGIRNAAIGGKDLFEQPEIAALVDLLRWALYPESPRRLERVVTSPVVPVTDRAIRHLARHGFDLDRALEQWPASGADEQRAELDRLRSLASECVWRRHQRKSGFAEWLLRKTGFDAAVLSTADGLQRYANVRKFVTLLDAWEDEEDVRFTDLLDRIAHLRAGEIVAEPPDIAQVADRDAADTVKLLTVHAAKGLEFPVVCLADTFMSERYKTVADEELIASRKHGFALRPSTGHDEDRQPTRIPAINGLYTDHPDDGIAFDRGALWISERRGNDGHIRHEHPQKGYVEDQRAEFWRIFYVAFTRACDHILFPRLRYTQHGQEWTNWAQALWEHFRLGDAASRSGTVYTPSFLDRNGTVRTIPIGIDDIGKTAPSPRHSPALAPLVGRVAPGASSRSGFVPRTVNPSRLHALRTDPAAYQREHYHGRSDGYTGSTRGQTPHPDVDPNVWGEIVHDAIEGLHVNGYGRADVDREDPAFQELLGQTVDAHLDDDPTVSSDAQDAVLSHLRTRALENYLGTETYRGTQTADAVFAEFPIDYAIDDAVWVYVRGQADLVYPLADGWNVTDIKTGEAPPDSGSDPQFTQYAIQLRTYAWLLEQVYDIEVTRASITYVYPETREFTVDPDTHRTGKILRQLPTEFEVDETGTLTK